MINSALTEIPPTPGQPPVNPASRGEGTGEREQGENRERGEGTGDRIGNREQDRNREQGEKSRQAVSYALSPIPYKGAAGLAADVRYYGEWMRERAWERIGHLYPKGPNGETVIAWLWARTVIALNPPAACRCQVRSFDLSKRVAGRNVW